MLCDHILIVGHLAFSNVGISKNIVQTESMTYRIAISSIASIQQRLVLVEVPSFYRNKWRFLVLWFSTEQGYDPRNSVTILYRCLSATLNIHRHKHTTTKLPPSQFYWLILLKQSSYSSLGFNQRHDALAQFWRKQTELYLCMSVSNSLRDQKKKSSSVYIMYFSVGTWPPD